MNINENAVLRLRIYGQAACRAVFTICIGSDRGQRYCGQEWRLEARRRQRHEANRRYRQSDRAGSPIAVASCAIGRARHNLL